VFLGAELRLRSIKSSVHAPNYLTALLLSLSFSYFLVLTILLFAVEDELVSGAEVITYIVSILLYGVVLYSYQTTYSSNQWAFSGLYTLKGLIAVSFPWFLFNFVVYLVNFGKEQDTQDGAMQPSLALNLLNLVPFALKFSVVALILVNYVKMRRSSRSRYRPLVDPNNYDLLIEEESPKPKKYEENAYERASVFSKVLMSWIYPLLFLGSTRPLEASDAEKIRQVESTEYQKDKMNEKIKKYLARKDDKRALLKAVYHRFGPEILTLAFIGSLATLMDFSGAVFIKLIEGFLIGDEPYWRGFAIVAYMMVAKFLQAIGNNQYRFNVSLLGAHLKAGISSNIFEKSLRISPNQISSTETDSAQFTYAQVVNLMQVDLERICSGIPYSLRAVIWPIQWSVGLYLLYTTVGWQGATAGVCLMIVLFSVNILIARRMSKIQKQVMEKRDIRMKFCNELLGNMKVFKLYNWENKIGERVQNSRENEMKLTAKYLKYQIGVIFLNWGTRQYLVIGIVVTMALVGKPLTPGDIFAGIAVIGILNMSIRIIPDIINNFLQMLISFGRIQDYMQAREIVDNNDRERGYRNPELAIGMQGASFSWEVSQQNESGELSEAKTVLKDIDFKVKKGEFVAVVGRVGSGKSSLLQALIQSMNFQKLQEDSYMFINGTLGYVSQEAWIQNTSIKDNILFGSSFDETKYKRVIKVSELKSDLRILPGGDMTEIGEKGINLSGGQKTRVAIARAAYAAHDILLLDDPLSAVDAHVGQAIFQKCFVEFLGGSTRIMVTNNQQFLPYVDKIVVMHEGKIVECGSFKELVEKDGYFKNEFLVQAEHPGMEHEEVHHEEEQTEEPQKKETKIIETEDRAVGRVSLSVYKTYFDYAGGWKTIALVVFFMSCWVADRMFSDLYLGRWTEQSQEEQERNYVRNILIFSIAGFSVNFFVLFRLLTTVLNGIKAAKRIFSKVLKALLDAPVNKFFDVTPVGRILNRLSKDQNIIDSSLLFGINASIGQIFTVVNTLIISVYVVPYVIIAIPVAAYLSFKVQQFYLSSSRELMRLESISRSPIIQHFSETISGVGTIRAFGYQDRFINKNAELLNNNIALYFQQQACNCWLGITLEFVADIVLCVSALVIVGTRGWIDPGLAGVALSCAVALPENIYWLIFVSSWLENMMVSVERVHNLSLTPPEAPRERPKDSGLKEWPSQGQIEFDNYQMKYRDETEIVLKGVTGTVKPRERIGIVGRTGSGKSSLCLSLFRLIEPYSGKISVDGVDISEIGLDLLRQKLCVIPQDPVLFQGKLRQNLDPFEECSEEELKDCISLTGMFPEEDPKETLEREVQENGKNFSLGQRQLICIARAILRKARIMFLDEATASIDYKTDEVIQNTIRDRFKESTVLTIAHRINTIMDYDRVMVMDNGVIAEFDTPQNLMEKKGLFYKLVVKHKQL